MYSHALISLLKTGVFPHGLYKMVDELEEKGIIVKEGKGRGRKLRLNLKR